MDHGAVGHVGSTVAHRRDTPSGREPATDLPARRRTRSGASTVTDCSAKNALCEATGQKLIGGATVPGPGRAQDPAYNVVRSHAGVLADGVTPFNNELEFSGIGSQALTVRALLRNSRSRRTGPRSSSASVHALRSWHSKLRHPVHCELIC